MSTPVIAAYVSSVFVALGISALTGALNMPVAEADPVGESLGSISESKSKPSRIHAVRTRDSRLTTADANTASTGPRAPARDIALKSRRALTADPVIRPNPFGGAQSNSSTLSSSITLPLTEPQIPPADWAGERRLFTGSSTIVSKVLVSAIRKLDSLPETGQPQIYNGLFTSEPPWFIGSGLSVNRSQSTDMFAWNFQPRLPSAKTVIAIHGGGYVDDPSVFHWLTYAAMAATTKAVVVVPMYDLVPQGGTALSEVPQIADFLAEYVSRFGPENVSVFGDSAGGGLALAATQELVKRGETTPGRMVLISPWLDITLSDPAIQLIQDPIASPVVTDLQVAGQRWIQGLQNTDPWGSPLYGLLQGLPPTTVFSGSLDVMAPDVLRLRQLAMQTDAEIDFRLRGEQFHAWPISSPLPDAVAAMREIYRQLGIANGRFKSEGMGRRGDP